MNEWIALNIGNSRLHWAIFRENTLQQRWDTEHKNIEFVQRFSRNPQSLVELSSADQIPQLWIASVVPEQTQLWQRYPRSYSIALQQIALHQVYPTFGLDRAVSVWGAIVTYGSPTLVIDCGTAITFSGADQNCNLVGGAILPGLRLQFQVLNQNTAALPQLGIHELHTLPDRWARSTETAIQSGILHTVLAGIEAFIQDWQQRFSETSIVLTGGDAALIHQLLNAKISASIKLDENVAFWGIRSIRNQFLTL